MCRSWPASVKKGTYSEIENWGWKVESPFILFYFSFLSLSLSLYIYIYIYMYMYLSRGVVIFLD